MQYTLTLPQARQFMLAKQGLCGPYRFAGRAGALTFVRQAGCLQFDPIDICGRNADIVLQSRVKGYTPAMLHHLLYRQRALVDMWDKNMCICPVEAWPAFARTRRRFWGYYYDKEQVEPAVQTAKEALATLGVATAKDLPLTGSVRWPWGSAPLGRAALETLFFRGEAVVHHKAGTTRYFALANRCLPGEILQAANPFEDDDVYYAWHTARRIGAVGLLWNRPSDAWLGIPDYNAKRRAAAFAHLEKQGLILPCRVEGVKDAVYLLAKDAPLLQQVLAGQRFTKRLEFIAPLDSFMWDRKLIEALFGFAYTWEVYTPKAKRKYGHYVLPVLWGQALCGRIELLANRKSGQLVVASYWHEGPRAPTTAYVRAVNRRLAGFAKFAGCTAVGGAVPQ